MQVGSLTSKILPNEILHYNYHLPHTLALINSMLNHYVQACEDPYNSKIWCPPHQNCITTSPLTLLSLFHQLLLHPITFFCNAYNKEESLGEFSGRSLEMHVYFLKDFTSVGLHSSLSLSLSLFFYKQDASKEEPCATMEGKRGTLSISITLVQSVTSILIHFFNFL